MIIINKIDLPQLTQKRKQSVKKKKQLDVRVIEYKLNNSAQFERRESERERRESKAEQIETELNFLECAQELLTHINEPNKFAEKVKCETGRRPPLSLSLPLGQCHLLFKAFDNNPQL